MHCSVPVGPLGPVLDVYFGVSSARGAAIVAAGGVAPGVVLARLLIDTGASHSSLDDRIIQQLQLQPTGSVAMHTPSTAGVPVQMPTYDVNIVIVGHNNMSHVIQDHSVTGCNFQAQGIDGLFGRDLLGAARLTYSGIDQFAFLSY